MFNMFKWLIRIALVVIGVGCILTGLLHLSFYVLPPAPVLTLPKEMEIGWWTVMVFAGLFWIFTAIKVYRK